MYLQKDKLKFSICNKPITRGGLRVLLLTGIWIGLSKYTPVNTGEYFDIDIVGVSVNGHRKDRLSFCRRTLLYAIDADVNFVTDNNYNRYRSFNTGERELASFLISHNYMVVKNDNIRSIWSSKNTI